MSDDANFNFEKLLINDDAARLRAEEQMEDVFVEMRKLEEKKAEFREQFASRFAKVFGREIATVDVHFKFCYNRLLMDTVQFDMFDFLTALRVVRRIPYEPVPELKKRVGELDDQYDYHGIAATELVDRDTPQSGYELLLQLQELYEYGDEFALIMINAIGYFTDFLREPAPPETAFVSMTRDAHSRAAPEQHRRAVYANLGVVEVHSILIDHYMEVVYGSANDLDV